MFIDIKKYEFLLVSICFGIPLVLTPLPFINDSYGNAGGWCWIPYENSYDLIWIFIEFYGFFVLVICLNAFFYYWIIAKIKKNIEYDEDVTSKLKLLKRLRVYPILLVVSYGPSFVYRLSYIAFGKEIFFLDIISGSFAALYGLFNAVGYGFTRKVRKSIRNFFKGKNSPSKKKKSLILE